MLRSEVTEADISGRLTFQCAPYLSMWHRRTCVRWWPKSLSRGYFTFNPADPAQCFRPYNLNSQPWRLGLLHSQASRWGFSDVFIFIYAYDNFMGIRKRRMLRKTNIFGRDFVVYDWICALWCGLAPMVMAIVECFRRHDFVFQVFIYSTMSWSETFVLLIFSIALYFN